VTLELKIDPGPAEVHRVLEDLTYEHLIDLVDFGRMGVLERVLRQQLRQLFASGQLGDDAREDRLDERAAEIFERAWQRVVEDPRRADTSHARAPWNPDQACGLCRALAEAKSPAKPHRDPS